MQLFNRNKSHGTPTGPVYQSFVESIFSDYRLLVIGVPTSVIAVLLTAYESSLLSLYAVAAAMLLAGGLRILVTARYHIEQERKAFSLEDYKVWEWRYTVTAVLHAFTFGVWCFVGALANNPVVEFASVVVTFANLIGVCGRCFPLARLVNGQLLAVGVPLIAGLYIQGGSYLVLALMLLPYLVSLRSIAKSQRENLLNNVINRRKAEKLAAQINSALESVPQGICMFDAQGNLEVSNRHISRFIRRTERSVKGISILGFVDLLNRDFGLSDELASEIRQWSLKEKTDPIAFQFELTAETKSVIRFRASRTPTGGTIATFEDITHEMEAASKIDHMERFDKLTGLMNRNQLPRYIDDKFESCKMDETSVVLLINVDKFKQINETYGHAKGDLLLCEVAERLSVHSEDIGVCARYGGDEFAIALQQKNGLDLAISLADAICDSFEKPFSVGRKRVILGCSIGIAMSTKQVRSAANLLKNADVALLNAKKNSRGDWRVYDAEMSREMQVRSKLEADLRLALAGNQFEAHYQPIVSIENRAVSVCEALLRWKHPSRGYVPPGVFVPIVEDLGLINEVGSWMLFEACRTCATWPNQMRVAVNLSSLQFRNDDIIQIVKDALSEAELEPSRLELEVTESIMLDNIDEAVAILHQLKELGVRVSLDDFGTGYSSLNYLNELPLDKVKIDRSFVLDLHTNPKSLTLVQAVTALGQKLDLTVVVEGIETEDQLQLLMSNAPVDEIQGYLFSKPANEEQISVLIEPSSSANRSMLSKLSAIDNIAA